jgi:hypothetical protein
MKLLLHASVICAMLVGSDYTIQRGADTRAVLNSGAPHSILVRASLGAHHVTEAARRQIARLWN